MAEITPPRPSNGPGARPSGEREDPLRGLQFTLKTPNGRDSASTQQARSSQDDGSHDKGLQNTKLSFQTSNFTPSTPSTTLEASDGSLMRTPFGNFTTWSSSSPEIVTPKPDPSFAAYEKDVRIADGSSSTGKPLVFPTPQMPLDFTIFSRAAQPPQSPLAAKGKAAPGFPKTQTIQEDEISRSTTPDEAVIEPLNLGGATSELSETPIPPEDEDEVITDSVDSVSSATTTSRYLRTDTTSLGDAKISVSAPTLPTNSKGEMPRRFPIPESIQRWLDTPSLDDSVPSRKVTSGPEYERKQEIKLKRLALFANNGTIGSSILEPSEHEFSGRVLRPKDDSNHDVFAIPGWPDDQYPWSVVREVDSVEKVRQRQRDLKVIERYLSDSSESDSEDDGPSTSGTDPADALSALLAKRSVRLFKQRLSQRQAEARDIPPQSQKEEKGKEKEKVDAGSEMDVDRDNDEVACICKLEDDGRPMVQCDNCHTWHHVDCVTKAGEELPDKWYCWKCPVGSAPDRKSNMVEPTFVPTSNDYSTRSGLSSAANVPIYQGSSNVQLSPEPTSHSHQSSATFFEHDRALSNSTPPPVSQYSIWDHNDQEPTSHRHSFNDRFDDPMAAIASPYTASGFSSSYPNYDDPSYENSQTPRGSLGLRFAPPFVASPRKERPWTNYTGTFATPAAQTTTQFTSTSNQTLPIVQTDPLFIHYEHDAPKQTAHHHQSSPSKGKKKFKGKDREKDKSEPEKEDSPSKDPPGARPDTDKANGSSTDAQVDLPVDSTTVKQET